MWRPLVLLAALAGLASAVRVTTKLGDLDGSRRLTPRTSRPYFAFTKVPYAYPPLGHLRLRNPVAQDPWPGVLDATKPAPACIQREIFLPVIRNVTFGEEDCLYLNVYTPTTDSSKKLPVLVYIHGGGFRCGQPIDDINAPTNFMEEDVVLVTVHYRVGPLGFLSTEDSQIPGNFGLKDQALAIKWVSENIDAFGGDPTSITVFGESAGGASVHYLITSPLSRDLLKGAIAQSGLTSAKWSLAPAGRAKRIAKQLGQIVGCEVNENFLDCLQEKEANELIEAESEFLVWDFDPAVVFQPVVEPDEYGAFLPKHPESIEVTKPFITGVVTGEGIIKTASVYQDEDILDQFIKNCDEYLPIMLLLEPDAPRLSDFISVVKARYFKNLSNRQEVFQGLEQLYSDALFYYPMQKTLKTYKGPIYGYIFDHRAANSFSIAFGPKIYNHEKPAHGDELLSLFNWTSISPETKIREEDVQTSIRLVKLWVNFGKHQNPTPEGSEIVWEPFNKNNVFLIKTDEDKMVHWPYDEVFQFWEKAYQIIEPPVLAKEEL